MSQLSVIERFEAKYIPEPNSGCWLWTGGKTRGYGSFRDSGRLWLAHRWAYEHFIGPVSENLDLDHLCRVRCCVNPWHLEPVTRAVNCQRGDTGSYGRSKTHCPQGHPYDEQNTYRSSGRRHCRKCSAQRQADYVRKWRDEWNAYKRAWRARRRGH